MKAARTPATAGEAPAQDGKPAQTRSGTAASQADASSEPAASRPAALGLEQLRQRLQAMAGADSTSARAASRVGESAQPDGGDSRDPKWAWPEHGEPAEPAASDVPFADASKATASDDEASRPDAEAGTRPAGRRKRRRPEPSPEQRALGLLVRREHSRKELTRKLRWRGVDADAADAAAQRMQDAGWQDDARFAESLVRSRGFSGHGPIRIRAELGTHGLQRELIETALEAFEGDWVQIARELVRRRHGRDLAEDRTRQRKAAELLIRRGYTADQIHAATRFDPDDDAW